MKLHFYQDRNGKWRWTLYGRNGRKVANAGEGYTRRIDCERMALKVLDTSVSGPLLRGKAASGDHLRR